MSDKKYQVNVICENCFMFTMLKLEKGEFVEFYLNASESNRMCAKCGCGTLTKITLDQYLNNMEYFSTSI